MVEPSLPPPSDIFFCWAGICASSRHSLAAVKEAAESRPSVGNSGAWRLHFNEPELPSPPRFRCGLWGSDRQHPRCFSPAESPIFTYNRFTRKSFPAAGAWQLRGETVSRGWLDAEVHPRGRSGEELEDRS